MAWPLSTRSLRPLDVGHHFERSYLSKQPRPRACLFCRERAITNRHFSSSSARRKSAGQHEGASFTSRLRMALRETKIKWYPIPVGLGIGFLGLLQFNRIQQRERARREEEEESGYGSENGVDGNGGRPRKRKRIRPSGPWYGTATILRVDSVVAHGASGLFRSCRHCH